MTELHFFRDYLTEKYGTQLQRIPIDPGFSCPHRGKSGGGCTFCSASGSRARHLSSDMDLAEQVRRGVEYVAARYHSHGPYIAYFQAFTGTNAPVETIRRVYESVLSMADFKMIIIGTRPDCLPPECIGYLKELQSRYDILVELGVQTANDTTLEHIHRGHDFACTVDAVTRLHEAGIPVAAHLILGLPGETVDDWRQTARKVAELPLFGVKFHQLMVLKGTALSREYAQTPFPTLNEYEYADGVVEMLKILPQGTVIMRTSADADEEDVIAPKWWMRKGQFADLLEEKFRLAVQGGSAAAGRFTPCRTEDGSYTLYHPVYRQHFHSLAGAWTETEKKYIEPSLLPEKLRGGGEISLLDIGFGMGCNAGTAYRLAEEIQGAKLHIDSIEFDRKVPMAAQTLPDYPMPDWLKTICEHGRIQGKFADLNLIYGDARTSVPDKKYDVIFLDGFSPDVNPELWTADFIRVLADHLAPGGVIATYSSAYPLFRAFLDADLTVFRSLPFGRRRPGTVAVKGSEWPLPPLSEKDRNIALCSTSGIPYRDATLRGTAEEILANRAAEVAAARAAGLPKWVTPRSLSGEE